MDIDPQDLERYRRTDSREDARAALDRISGRAQHSLKIFDASGEFWGLERKDFADSVRSLLLRRRDAAITLVVHDVRHIERRCPRLVDLLRMHSPRLRVLLSEPSARTFSTGLVIADGTVVLRRPHMDQPQVFTDFDEAAVSAAERVFEELVDGAQPGVAGATTGL